jgi:chromosome segregation ATPase
MEYVIGILESKLNITKEIYEDAIKKYAMTRISQIESIKQSRQSLNKQISKLKDIISGLSRSLTNSSEKGGKAITEAINEKSEELTNKQEEYEQLGEDLIRIESKITEEAMPYEKFSNFFKKAGETIKSNRSTYLLDQLIRNIFSNFFVEDGKVVGHRLKEPFATYENLGSHVWGSIWKVIRNGLMQYYLNIR